MLGTVFKGCSIKKVTTGLGPVPKCFLNPGITRTVFIHLGAFFPDWMLLDYNIC